MAKLLSLRVLHVIASVASVTGGPAAAIGGMCRALEEAGADVSIATTTAFMQGELPATGRMVDHCGVPTVFFPCEVPPHLSISIGLTRWLGKNIGTFDVVHIHGVFTYPSTIAGRIARSRGVPYLVRPLGGLSRYSLRRHALRKRVYMGMFEREYLNHASGIHFTAPSEAEEAADLGLKAPALIVPLGVPEPVPVSGPEVQSFAAKHNVGNNLRLLYLGRLDPKKGLELLFEALASAHRRLPEWQLLIAGSGPAAYTESLRMAAERAGIAGRVLFLGEVRAAEKAATFSLADIFVLPSKHENFAVAAAEAMRSGLPVIVSQEVGIAPYVGARGSGMVCESNVESLAKCLVTLASDATTRREMGETGRRVAAETFAWPLIAQRLLRIYRDILGSSAAVSEFSSSAGSAQALEIGSAETTPHKMRARRNAGK
jgi:glycosyltransferase involved in cell wall biosynthesis